jgi:LmbE family N-acetylglucosaminyl deacetylase
MNILVIAPHPDDDIIGCGGSIAKHVSKGSSVSVIFMTSGETGSGNSDPATLKSLREKEASEATKILGVTSTFFLGLPNGDLVVNKQTIEKVVDIIKSVKPDIVYLPHKKDNHRDHKASFEIGIEAISRAESKTSTKVTVILAYEVWTPITEVTYIEDISAFIDKKIQALQEHKTQIDNTRFDEAIKGLNRYRGIMKGSGGYSECFEVIKLSELPTPMI